MSGSSLRAVLRPIRRSLRNRFYIIYGMRGTAPINPGFGADRGTPIDRYYVDRFLDENRERITGRVLEIGDRRYTTRFGTAVTRSDVLNAVPSTDATYVGDLASCPEIPDETYDCLVLTQMLHYIYDMEAAVREMHRILKPGGSVLCTVPGISQISRFDMERWGDRWRLTSLSAREVFTAAFENESVEVVTYGNALAAVCLLQTVPAERVNSKKLARREEDYEVIVAVAARRGDDG